MQLVSINDIEKISGLKNKRINQFIMHLLGFNNINKFYYEHESEEPLDFLISLLNEFNVKIDVKEKDLRKIPLSGGFLTVSNHPFGGWDGIILLYLMLKKRPDFKIMANFLLEKINPLKSCIIAVNPFENISNYSSISGLKKALWYIKNDVPVGIFPAGEVSSFSLENKKITDKRWDNTSIRLIRASQKPILPVYFKGTNSMMFNTIGLINPKLRSAALGRELLKKKNTIVNVKIGDIISIKEQTAFNNNNDYGRYLRARTYALGNKLNTNQFYFPRNLKLKSPEKIIKPVNSNLLIKEIQDLSSEDLLFEIKDFQIFCTSVKNLPNIIIEIGRLREETFREVGEGTNKSIDLDEFDLYYKHLFIWNKKTNEIIGAYRIGEGDSIMRKYGKSGFYMNQLFRIDSEFNFVLERGLEMGRSFIVKHYQKNALMLYLLWKGVFYYLLNNVQFQFLFGPVSISNSYSKISQKVIVDFIKDNHFDSELSKLVKPRKAFKYNKNSEINYSSFRNNNMITLDNLIAALETNHFKVPVLIKKYIGQNGKFIGFNIDPKFSKSLDGFLLLDLKEIDKNTIKSLGKDLDENSVIKRFK
tara:strand:- start:3048 stop:4811 length:1764 start_codon:yes stop_codon:yes gene_type:complete